MKTYYKIEAKIPNKDHWMYWGGVPVKDMEEGVRRVNDLSNDDLTNLELRLIEVTEKQVHP